MKPLRKSETKRFAQICKTIREALKIDHWRCSYHVNAKEDGSAMATYHTYDEGEYITIYFRPMFWTDDDAEWQMRALIHEHVHAVLSPLTQAYNKICGRLHESDCVLAKDIYQLADERATCHLEAVVFDLLKGKI